MRVFRTLPTSRLLALLAALTAVVVAGTIAVAARGGSSATPPEKPLANAIHDALTAPAPGGITARIHFTNNLFPSGAFTGQTGSALMSSASGRLWVNGHGGRLELQSDGGDAQITWTESKLTVFDASSNTAYVADLPRQRHGDAGSPPSLDEIGSFLRDAAAHWSISAAQPSIVAGREAYTVSASPEQHGGLLGSAELAWDALHGTPLKVAVYAKGASSPALALEATGLSYGSVPDGDVLVTPPASARVVDLSAHGHDTAGSGTATAAGLPALPDTLEGRARTSLQRSGAALIAVYGDGLDSIAVVERKADKAAQGAGPLGSLPEVKLDGLTAHELSTQLGTAVTWDAAGVTYLLAGSVAAATAESAARALR